MHIPDGYLSPQTYVPLAGVYIVVATVAAKKIKKEVSVRYIPYLGMAAAFSFIVMMFNLPIPGGTTGHATGSAIIALLFGPWAATIAVSVALIIQTFIFGDGGITALGANCLNLAVVMPFAAYGIFRLFNNLIFRKPRIFLSAFLSGYISVVIAALITAIELGIQPLIASSPEGVPLYCPYGLDIAVPAMTLEYLFFFGIVEGLMTALVFRYFFNSEPGLIYAIKKRYHEN